MSASRLAPIVAAVARRAAARREHLPLAALHRRVRPDPSRRLRFVAALARPGLSIVAECKRRSPSAGWITGADEPGPVERARAYATGGAAAVSVLTERDHFGGDPADLLAVAAADLPVLRKDFLLDEGMVLESALWGASAVLLLPAILDDRRLAALARLAGQLGLAAVVEAHDERELERALAVEPPVIGLNARNLHSFAVDLASVERLLPTVPAGPLRLAESGLANGADLARVHAAGADAALVGEALMRAADPAATLAAWREALHA